MRQQHARPQRMAPHTAPSGPRIRGAASTTPMVNLAAWAGPTAARTVASCPAPLVQPSRRASAAPSPGPVVAARPGARPCTWPGRSRRRLAALLLVVAGLPRVRPTVGCWRWSSWWSCSWPCPLLTGIHRHRLRVTAGVEIPPQPRYRAPAEPPGRSSRRPGPRPPGASSATTSWSGRRWPRPRPPPSDLARGPAVTRWCTPTRGGAAPGQPAPARPSTARCPPPPGAAIPVDVYLTARRDRAAAGRAVAYRRGRGARRQGGPGAAGPEPRRGTGAPGGAPDPDPGRRGRRGRRRAAAPGAGPARRHPAAAGLPGHEPGHGPRPGQARPRRRSRPSRRPTRRPRPPSPSSGT